MARVRPHMRHVHVGPAFSPLPSESLDLHCPSRSHARPRVNPVRVRAGDGALAARDHEVWGQQRAGRRASVQLLDDEELMAKLRVDASKLARAEPVGVPTAFRRTVDGELVTDSAEVASLLDAAQLNESQRNAVTSALAQRLTLIQGPPGTGKTYIACAILRYFYDITRLK